MKRRRPRPNLYANEVAALVGRVHRPPLACRSCGAGTDAAPAGDGWPTCHRCADLTVACGAPALAAVAGLLDLDPAEVPELAVGRLTGPPLYADTPGAAPDRPRPPWGHVSALIRADVVDRLRSLVDADRRYSTGGPCSRCGARWSSSWDAGPEQRPICGVCATDGLDGPRSADRVAADLVGLLGIPTGCADAIGFTWATDTSGATPGEPWAHLNLDALRARARTAYPLPGQWESPAAARAAGVTQPDPTMVAWKVTGDDGPVRPDGAGGVRGGKQRTLAPVARTVDRGRRFRRGRC